MLRVECLYSPDSYLEILTLNMMVQGGRALGDDEVMRVGPP